MNAAFPGITTYTEKNLLIKKFLFCFSKIILLFLTVFMPLYMTLTDYGVTSDEPIYQEAATEIKKWLEIPFQEMINKSSIEKYWKTDPARNVHPSGTKLLYIIAQKLIFWEKNYYRQNAIFNIIFFGFSIVIFMYWYFNGNFINCLIALLILLTIPRFFAHAHFPATDIPMSSFLILLIVSMDRTFKEKYFWLSGIILGIFFSFKITSVLLILPVILAYLVWYRGKFYRTISRFFIIFLVGAAVFYTLNPDYWLEPYSRIKEFIAQSSTRKEWTPFTVLFGGKFYQYRAPYYYPFTMFLITTPILHIIFMLAGLWASSKYFFKEKKTLLILLCSITPFIILALPVSPAHDGIRYLLPAYPFMVCFMVIGLKIFYHFLKDISYKPMKKNIIKLTVLILLLYILAIDIHNPSRVPPFELSYYNSLIGELRGAQKKGYETTYWWEIINDRTLDKINNTCRNKTVYFPFPPVDFYFMHMVDSNRIHFKPAFESWCSDFMLVYGRPYVEYWESYAKREYLKYGNTPVPLWSIDIDGIPLLKVYKIVRLKNEK